MPRLLSIEPHDVVLLPKDPLSSKPDFRVVPIEELPSGAPEGSQVFRVRGLDYWTQLEAEAAVDGKANAALQRQVMARAILAIDGSAPDAAKFLERPAASVANALFSYVQGLTWGN